MHQFKFVLSALVIISLLTACNKNISEPIDTGTDTTVTTPSTQLPKTYTEEITSSAYGNSKTTYNLTWDASNRLTLLAQANDPTTKMVYTYSSNKYTLEIVGGGEPQLYETFYLNSSSLVDSTFQYDITEDSTTEKYFYNAQKQQTSLNEYAYSLSTGSVLSDTYTYTYDSNGDQLTETDSYSTQTMTWYTDKPYQFSIGGAYFTQPLHLIKSLTITSGGQTETIDYVYVFDDNGRISSEQDAYSNGDQIVKTYTY